MQRRWAGAAVLAGTLLSSRARADPHAACSARLSSSRVLVDPSAKDLFEEQQLSLVRLGLVGRVHVEAILVRHRPLWFDERLDSQSLDFIVAWSPAASTYLVDGHPLADLRELSFERLALHLGGDASAGDSLSVEVRARLQVVTASSLGTVAGWMVEGERTRATRTLLEVLADDLTRSASSQCAVAR